MLGIGVAKAQVTAWLQANLANTIYALRPVLGLPAATDLVDWLPTPANYYPFEPPALDDMVLPQTGTSAVVYLGGTDTVRLEGHLPSMNTVNDYYDVIYQLAAIVWVKGQAWGDVIRGRDNLVLAVRECMLSRPSEGTDPSVHGSLLDINTVRERYAWPEIVRGGRHLAGGTVGFQYRVRENIVATGVPVISDTVQAFLMPPPDAPVFPPHPAL